MEKTVRLQDVIKAIGKGIGVKFDADQIINDVKENFGKLFSCPGPHDFQKKPDDKKILGAKYVCSHCKGEVGGVERNWYERGLEHGKKLR